MSWISTKLFGYRQILFGTTVLPQRGTVNFVSGVTVADNPATGATDVTIDASTVFTDATHLAVPDKIVKRSPGGNSNFSGTCAFVDITASGNVAVTDTISCNDIHVASQLTVSGIVCSVIETTDLAASGAATVTGTLACGDTVSSATLMLAPSFKLSEAVTETRVQQGRPFSLDGGWTAADELTWINAVNDAKLFIPLDLPNGVILDDVSIHIQPVGGHSDLPTTRPAVTVQRRIATSGTSAVVSGPVADTSANVANYQAFHAIEATDIGHTVNAAAYRYYVELTAEGGTNDLVGCQYFSTTVTYTRPAGSLVGQD